MQIPNDFAVYTLWLAYATGAFFVLMLLAFLFKWGIRFRLVGATAFTAVLTVGAFGLSLGLFSRTDIPGSVRYNLVYDDAAAHVVIVVDPTVTPDQVEATLKQAALDIAPFGRLGNNAQAVMVRARTVLHPEPGISLPLYLGEAVKLSQDPDALGRGKSEAIAVRLYSENFAQLPPAPEPTDT
jgi:hypothetical protein